MAVAALGTAREMGVSVPGGLSIVAGAASQLCLLAPPSLTALSRDVSAYGARVARTLLDVIAGNAPASVQEMPARLVVRASTGPAGSRT